MLEHVARTSTQSRSHVRVHDVEVVAEGCKRRRLDLRTKRGDAHQRQVGQGERREARKREQTGSQPQSGRDREQKEEARANMLMVDEVLPHEIQ
eukprot:2581307-Amphidinium_carterae.5